MAPDGQSDSSAPLAGIRVLDLTRYGPGPYCAMLLGDLGADVIVVDEATPPEQRGRRAGSAELAELLQAMEFMRRNARRIALDLRHPDGQAVMQRLVARADVLLEGFRPGVAARLGLDAETLRRAHPRLVYCSISGYGQAGPYRERAGHDINYLALGGLLGLTGAAGGPPVLPGTLVADLAAGGLPAAVAILGALLARERSGAGRTLDVAVQEGVAALVAPLLALYGAGEPVGRGEAIFTGAAPWYGVYETADGRHLAVGAIEPWFWAALCERLERPEWTARQFERAAWPAIRGELRRIFLSRPLDVWLEHFAGSDACVTPVHSIAELLADPQLAARGTFTPDGDDPSRVIPRALPLLRDTPPAPRRAPSQPGGDSEAILAELG
jgi:alpha-methylacyl-CoA racemase